MKEFDARRNNREEEGRETKKEMDYRLLKGILERGDRYMEGVGTVKRYREGNFEGSQSSTGATEPRRHAGTSTQLQTSLDLRSAEWPHLRRLSKEELG